MAVLVAGGAGFVGSHLVDRLVAGGEHVVVCDNLATGRLANLEVPLARGSVTFVYVDLAEPAQTVRAAIDNACPDRLSAVFHLASPASPLAYDAMPWETLAVNAMGTFTLIDLALAHNAVMLFASTSEVYGDPLVEPQSESYFGNVNPVGPRSCYDEGKRFGEAAMAAAIRARGLNGRIIRIFNTYGPRMALADGRLIPALFEAARAGLPFPIHGDGEQTRSLTYVDDLVDGILTVAQAPLEDVTPVNLGSEDERSVVDIAREVASVCRVPFTVDQIAARPEDPRRRRPEITRARELGWEPRTALRVGLERTASWLDNDALQYA